MSVTITHEPLAAKATGHVSVSLATHQLQKPCHPGTPATGKEGIALWMWKDGEAGSWGG